MVKEHFNYNYLNIVIKCVYSIPCDCAYVLLHQWIRSRIKVHFLYSTFQFFFLQIDGSMIFTQSTFVEIAISKIWPRIDRWWVKMIWKSLLTTLAICQISTFPIWKINHIPSNTDIRRGKAKSSGTLKVTFLSNGLSKQNLNKTQTDSNHK